MGEITLHGVKTIILISPDKESVKIFDPKRTSFKGFILNNE